ncbi:MAG: adenosylcobinamide-GDP ribazoletransferase [Bauldia sp.]
MKDSDSGSTTLGALVGDLQAAIVFLTRLPPSVVGVEAGGRPDFRRGARAFPVAGALIGAVGGSVVIGAAILGLPPLVSAGLAVAATMLLTGGLHEDGLADTADSFGGATSERKLQIMDDSSVGAAGPARPALVFSVVFRVGGLAAIAEHSAAAAALALVAAEAVSRAALVRLWHDLPAARTSGLGRDTGPPDQGAMLVALAIAGLIAAVAAVPAVGWRATALACFLAALATYVFIRMTARTIGGYTGDALGACQQVALAAFLIGASAG